MKVLVATEKPFAAAAVEGIKAEIEGAGNTLALLEKYTEKQQLLDAVKDADALIIRSDKVDAEVLDAAKQLKIVVRAGAGYDNIDLAAATAHDVVAENTPGQNANAVAELVFGLLVFAVRNFYNGKAGTELKGKKLGILAFGNVGRNVARIAAGFGMEVYADTSKNSASLPEGIQKTTFEGLLGVCDILTLHCPLTDKTRELVNAETIARMRHGAIIINTGRGPLVNEADVAEALKSGQLSAYGADVMCQEPPRKDNPLLSCSNAFITPHVAWATFDARQRLMRIAVDNVRAFIGGTPKNVVS